MVHIKHMRLRGFKSIGATKTVQIDFDKGFSAIVGANGSGKSNILEAFSFVMGNLSAKSLRGENMRNMIFSGNQKVGIPAAQEAHVELVLDNADRGLPLDADIVKISRSIDLDGRGKYKINGRTATRTEVQDLLSLGGLHASSYSMVLQGSVYEVVNMSKFDRRKLIEEIAGIAAYDEKKFAAQKELDTVETNLSQVRLLMNEVSTQLAELEKEKDEALKYQHLVKTLEASTIALRSLEISAMRDEIAGAKEENAMLDERLRELDKRISIEEETLVAVKQQISILNADLAAKQGQELLQITNELDRLKQAMGDIKSSIRYINQARRSAEDEKARTMEEITRLEGEKAILLDEIRKVESILNEHQESIEKQKARLDSKHDELASHDQQYKDLLAKKETLRQALVDTKNALNETKTEFKMVESQLHKERAGLETIERELSGSESQRSDINARLQGLRRKVDEARPALGESPDQIQAGIKRAEGDLRATRDAIRQKSEEIYELRSMAKAAQQFGNNGLNKAINGLLEAKKQGIIKGIHDIIGNLGKVDAKFAVAMDIAAGGKTNFLVVDNQGVATECIKFLKRQNLGRLSFIPLDKIQYKDNNRDQQPGPGVHGRAVDLIDFDLKYLPAFEFIFGRTFIVEDLEIAKIYAPSYRKVTIDGDVVDPSNLMTGGSVNKKQAGGAFHGKDEEKLPRLEQDLEALKGMERDLDRQIRGAQERITQYYTAKIQAEKDASGLKEQVVKLEARLEEIEAAKAGNQQRRTEMQANVASLVKRRDEIQLTVIEREAAVAGVEKDIGGIDNILAASPHAQLKEDIDALAIEIKKLESALNKQTVVLTQKTTRLDEHVITSLDRAARRLADLDGAISKSIADLQEKETEKDAMASTMKDLEAQVAKKNDELATLLEKRKELERAKENTTLSIQKATLEHQAAGIKRGNAATKLHDLQARLDAMCKELPEQATVDEAFLKKGKATLAGDIDSCKREIDALGNVNMMAIDKYNDNKKRFDELNGRHELLVKEREAIIEFMTSIETQKKAAFMQTFQSIARNFSYIFSRLSPGGEGRLELENLEDPFAAGVQIMARPAGKPLNEISLLSGGEKSLTSLSLIFAIQQHCPSPLYILDEIDAALDDANAALVADLIKELSARSQFIIVTHRDVTMTRVDQILGVSNVDGVTDVVGLRLSEISRLLAEA